MSKAREDRGFSPGLASGAKPRKDSARVYPSSPCECFDVAFRAHSVVKGTSISAPPSKNQGLDIFSSQTNSLDDSAEL
jgi:hypothetical protein